VADAYNLICAAFFPKPNFSTQYRSSETSFGMEAMSRVTDRAVGRTLCNCTTAWYGRVLFVLLVAVDVVDAAVTVAVVIPPVVIMVYACVAIDDLSVAMASPEQYILECATPVLHNCIKSMNVFGMSTLFFNGVPIVRHPYTCQPRHDECGIKIHPKRRNVDNGTTSTV
jgi:hypothetical protein